MPASSKAAALAENVIGQRLKTEMKKRGMSSARLATMAGVKTSFIYDIISGKSTNPSTVKLARVADSLGISLKSLVDHLDTGAMPAMPPTSDYMSVPRIVVDTSRMETTVTSVHSSEDPFCFRRSWITQRLNIQPEHVRAMVMSGDSMEPTFCHGDNLLIDTGSKHPSPPGIFVIYDGFGLTPKRLELLTHTPQPRVRVLSDNPQYTGYEKSLDEIAIMGRVVWFARTI